MAVRPDTAQGIAGDCGTKQAVKACKKSARHAPVTEHPRYGDTVRLQLAQPGLTQAGSW
ncbi:hypothetical protein HispidOSU_015371 [Sigmodon hispidus]